MNILVVLAVLLPVVLAQKKVDVTKCGGDALNEVRFRCEGSPCKFKRGETETIEVDFTPSADFDKLNTRLQAQLAGAWIDAPGFDRDGCKFLKGASCPVKKGQKYTYKYDLTINKNWPQVKVTFKYQMKDKDNKDIWCFTVPVAVA